MNRLGLRGRLLIAQLLVLFVGAATLTVVATLVAAPLFHYHLAHAGVEDAQVRLHTEEAFAQAGAVALAAGAAVALGAAAITSVARIQAITSPPAGSRAAAGFKQRSGEVETVSIGPSCGSNCRQYTTDVLRA